ncbi:putative von Willebrand factor, type A [Candidatus Sulfopaludibacter sp. SbA3]|nr:putative von Willebrand factor, type A [Candidatus Sulfopaludibacter sp. SbA3]
MRYLVALMACGLLCRAQDDVTFHAGVSLVHVDAEVTSADGRLLTGFTKADFRLLDEGKPETIANFSADEQPLDLILLFDVSGSMRAVVGEVAASAHEGLQELRKGDRVCVMVFNSRSWALAPFTEDLDAVARTLENDLMRQRFGGGTLIQAAVDAAAERLRAEKRSERRRAVLIVTDNMGMRTMREETVVRDYWEADAILSGLIISNPKFQTMNTIATIMGPQRLLMQAGMKGIAEKTGGDAIKSDDPGRAFQQMMHRIRSRYSLYYPMPTDKPGKPHTIRVELIGEAAKTNPKAVIHARKGYLMPGK